MINRMFAFVMQDDDDGELLASRLPFVGGVLLVTVHADDLPSMERAARKVADKTGVAVHLVEFERRVVQKVLYPRKKSP